MRTPLACCLLFFPSCGAYFFYSSFPFSTSIWTSVCFHPVFFLWVLCCLIGFGFCCDSFSILVWYPCILVRTYADLTFFVLVWGIRLVSVIVCIIFRVYLFSSWGNLPLQSYWSLSCDHGLHRWANVRTIQYATAVKNAGVKNSSLNFFSVLEITTKRLCWPWRRKKNQTLRSAWGSATKILQECTTAQKNKKLPKHLPRSHQAPNQAAFSPKLTGQLILLNKYKLYLVRFAYIRI